jgi:hypothetical protein
MAGWTLYSLAKTKGTIPCGRAACQIIGTLNIIFYAKLTRLLSTSIDALAPLLTAIAICPGILKFPSPAPLTNS